MDNEKEYDKLEKESLLSILSETEKLANVGGWEWDIGKDVWTFSDNWLRMHGCSKRHLRTPELLPMAHPDDRANIQKAFDRAISKGCRYEIEHRIIHQVSGEILYIRACGAAKLDKDGVPVKMYGSSQDITEHKQAEEALRASEELLFRSQEIAHIGSWRLDLSANSLTWSDEVYRIFGCEPQEFAATYEGFLDFVHPNDRAAVDEAYSRSQQEGSDGYEIEHRIVRRKSGEVRYVHERCVHERDAAGIINQSTGMVQDITERKRAEEENRIFRTISDNAVYGKAIANLEGNLLYVNRFLADLHGYEPEQLIGKHFSLFHSREQTEAADRLIASMMREGCFGPTTVWHHHQDGTEFPMLMSGVLIKDDYGNPQCIAASAIDMTAHQKAEEALRASEENHRRLFETMSQGVIYHASDGEIISANPAAEKILGLSFDQMRGKTSMDPRWKMIKEDGSAVPGTEHPAMIALRTGQTVGPVRRGVFHSGKNSHIWLSITAIPLFRQGEAAPFQVYATITDITEHLEREFEYSQILNTSIDGFWVVDTRGHFLEVNPAAVGLLGYTREEMLARRISDIEAIESPEEMDQHIKTIKKQGYERFETQHRHKDGHLLDVEVSTSFLAHPYERLIVFTRDISERKQKERENHINRLRLEILNEINKMPGATEKMINDLILEKMLSLSGSEIGFLGYITDDEEVMEIHSWSDKAMQRCAFQDKPMVFPIQQAGLWGEPIRNRTPLIVNDYSQPHSAKQGFPEGHIQISSFMAIPVFEDSSIVAIAGVGNKKWPYDDIDVQQLELLMSQWWEVIRRKRLYNEKTHIETQLNQVQKMESVGRLAGGVAHDFNNKLTIINGYAEMAAEMIDPSDPLHETIQEIFTAGKKSADIVRQLLAFARKQTISPVHLDLNDTISSMLKMLQRLIGENIDIEWHPGIDLAPVTMDPSQVDQIMANLAVNSRDAISDVGKLTIETDNIVVDEDYCRGNPEAIPGRYVMLAVTDDGCGMEKEVQKNLFEPFFTTKEIGKGTGLGLPTIYGIVKQNNGFINVYSEPGEGTTFKLYFPSHEEATSSLHSAKESSGQIPTGTETVLVVEDEKTILQISKQMLERLGYTVETAGSPAEALQISKEYDGTIHLLITDVIMPEMNGRHFSSQLIQTHPDVKTLYMSGYTADVIAHHGVLDEGLQFIQKPFSLKDLAVKVREVLAQE